MLYFYRLVYKKKSDWQDWEIISLRLQIHIYPFVNNDLKFEWNIAFHGLALLLLLETWRNLDFALFSYSLQVDPLYSK